MYLDTQALAARLGGHNALISYWEIDAAHTDEEVRACILASCEVLGIEIGKSDDDYTFSADVAALADELLSMAPPKRARPVAPPESATIDALLDWSRWLGGVRC